MGFLLVANASMTRPIRALSEGRGYETSAHNLVCFGGAGGQHATAIARDLGIKRVLIHRFSSILSAYGMALADVVVELQEPESGVYNKDSAARIEKRADAAPKGVDGSLLGLAHEVLQLGEDLFDGVEVRAVARQVDDLDAQLSGFRRDHPRHVARRVVPD